MPNSLTVRTAGRACQQRRWQSAASQVPFQRPSRPEREERPTGGYFGQAAAEESQPVAVEDVVDVEIT